MKIQPLRLALALSLLLVTLPTQVPAQDEERCTTVLKGHSAGRFSPDGKRIITLGDGTIKVWDAEKGSEILTIKGCTSSINSVALSPDGKRIVGWNDSKQSMMKTVDGQQFFGSSTQTVKVWDAEKGTVLRTIKGLTGLEKPLALSPDGKRLVSISNRGGTNSLYPDEVWVWNMEKGTATRNLKGAASAIFCVTFSPDSKRIFCLTNGSVKSWDAEKGTETLTFKVGTDFTMSLSPDGKRLVTAGNSKTVKVWNTEKGDELLTLKLEDANDKVGSVAYSPDGKRLVGACLSGTLRLWDAEKGTEIGSLKGHKKVINTVAYSPDGKRIVSGSFDQTVKVWDVAKFEGDRPAKTPEPQAK